MLNKTAVALFVVAVATGVIAFLIYPNSSSVTVQGAIQGVSIVGNLPLTGVDVEETADAAGHGVGLVVTLRSSSNTTSENARLVLVVPTGAWGSPDGCPTKAVVCLPDQQPGFKDAVFRFPSQWVNGTKLSQPAYAYEVVLSVHVSDIAPNLVQNPEFIATLLPPVSVRTEQPRSPSLQYTPVPVNYSENVRGGDNYTWKEGKIPVVSNGFVYFGYLSASDLQSGISQTLNTGVDLAVQDRNSNLIFLAGTLLGVAGGALIGAVTEAIRGRDTSGGDNQGQSSSAPLPAAPAT